MVNSKKGAIFIRYVRAICARDKYHYHSLLVVLVFFLTSIAWDGRSRFLMLRHLLDFEGTFDVVDSLVLFVVGLKGVDVLSMPEGYLLPGRIGNLGHI